MNTDKEKIFIEQVNRHLDESADSVDELTAARLRAMRKRAVDGLGKPHFNWLPVTGFATAAAAILAVLVWNHNGGFQEGFVTDAELLALGADFELIEELEFYDWLDETQSNS